MVCGVLDDVCVCECALLAKKRFDVTHVVLLLTASNVLSAVYSESQ